MMSGGGGEDRQQLKAEAGVRLYNPYDFYGIPSGARQNQKQQQDQSDLLYYRLPTAPEFLFPEEEAHQRRGLGENIQYYAGCGYLGGAVAGGARGAVAGLRAREADDTRKLRANRVLNASGHAGRALGNKLGVLGLLYASLEYGVWHFRGADDVLNPVLAGLGTGALYKAAAGPRTAAIAGALGGATAAGIIAGKHFAKRYLPI